MNPHHQNPPIRSIAPARQPCQPDNLKQNAVRTALIQQVGALAKMTEGRAGPPALTGPALSPRLVSNFLSSGSFEGQRRADQQFSLARLNRASPFVPFP